MRRDYLKHLGFATAQAMAATQTPMTLPTDLFNKIEKEAIDYGVQNPMISPYIAYRRGATEWAGKAQKQIEAALHKERNAMQAKITDLEIGYLKQIKELTDTLLKVSNIISWMDRDRFWEALYEAVGPSIAKYKEVGNG